MREIYVIAWVGPEGLKGGTFNTALESEAEFNALVEWLNTHGCKITGTNKFPLEHFKDGNFYYELSLADVPKHFPGALQGAAEQFFNRWHPSGRWDKDVREFWENSDGDPLYQFFEQDGVLRAEYLGGACHNATNAVLAQTMYWWPERKLWYAMHDDMKIDPETRKEIE